MRDDAFALIVLEPYLQLLAEILPWADGFAISDGYGMSVSVSDEALRTQFEALLADHYSKIQENHVDSNPLSVCKLQEGQTYFHFNITTASGKLIGIIGMTAKREAEDLSYSDTDQLAAQLNIVAKCLRNEYELTAELNTMATELAGRYEELNLLYMAEDEIEHTSLDSDTLTPFLDSCVEHLDVGLATLIMPEQDILLLSVSKGDPITDLPVIMPTLTGEFYDWMKSTGECVVLNDFVDDRRAQHCPDIPYKMLACPVLDANQRVIGLMATLNGNHRADFLNSDRSLLKALAKKISKIAQVKYDALTGLIHRSILESQVQKCLISCRKSAVSHCVLAVDVDQLQVINDTAGHEAGDEVIRRVSRTLNDSVRDADVVGYLGRGKFGVLLERCRLHQGKEIAENLRRLVQQLTIDWRGQCIEPTISVGVVQMNADSSSAPEVLDAAEIARDAAKELGRNRVQVYLPESVEITRRKDYMQWVGRIQCALREDKFQLYCQPIRSNEPGSSEQHIEILLRMLNGGGVLIDPGSFIPAGERYHLMPTIDRWVVSHALDALAGSQFERRGKDWVCAINLSGQSLVDEGFTAYVSKQLERSTIPPENICFEITETAAISDLEAAKRFIVAIKKQGCSFSLDDFGTGLSTFTYLRALPVDFLKIDGSFVRYIIEDPIAEAMVSAINQVGHVMGLKTIAEFVESDAIKERLETIGVDYVQGYAIGKPRPLADELEYVKKSRRRKSG